MNDFEKLTKKDTWNRIWNKYIEKYVHSNPKHGKIVEKIAKKYNINFSSCLETGCGSARDSRYLSEKCKAYCLDLSSEPLKVAYKISKELNTDENYFLMQGDVFNLPFKDKSIDVSFNSGLLVYFSANEDIYRILAEQSRVTKRLMIIFVHNKFDLIMSILFKYLYHIKGEDLYNIRRFWYENTFLFSCSWVFPLGVMEVSFKEIEDICERFGKVLEVGACEYTVPIVINKFKKVFFTGELNLEGIHSKIDKRKFLKNLFFPTEIYAAVDLR